MTTFRHSSSGFVKINKVIPQTAKQYSLEGALYRHKAMRHWPAAAAGFFPEAASGTKALEFKDGILTVACLSGQLAYQIRLMAQKIIKVLNELIGKAVVFALRLEM